jgi:poly [ADP-ribose] polymerase
LTQLKIHEIILSNNGGRHMTLVKTAKYIKSDVRKNNNKFWYIELYDNAMVVTRYGRVGKKEQRREKSFVSQGSAEVFYSDKIREKTREGRNGEIAYRPLNVVQDGEAVEGKVINDVRLKDIAVKQIKSKNKSIVQKMIEYFTSVNAHNITDATGGQITFNQTTGLFSTPLGIVTQANIDEANRLLVQIGDKVAKGEYDRKLEDLTNSYLMLVPQDLGMSKIHVESVFRNVQAVQRQKSIVDSLEASLASIASKPVDDAKAEAEAIFDVELDLVTDSKIINSIKRKFKDGINQNHDSAGLKVKTVYAVRIAKEDDAFKQGSIVGNIKELWHGTRVSNILSILKCGLVIPPSSSAHCTGRMYGDGLYFSDQSTKSLNYSHGYWGGSQDDNCFMFLAEVAMGKEYSASRGWGSSYPVAGYDSTFAKGGTAVMNNEMVVYKTAQARLKYLVEFSA